tara:strand:+ start:4599 stop:5777 length:1179 start_codon:yes stop_codon:yes gene_type:complete
MIKYISNTLLFIISINFLCSQNLDSLYVSKINDTILSKYLNEKRSFEIQLPRSYNIESEKNYPLMIVLDGDYMFNMVAGSVDYLSYWGEIPENIVVGINQRETRTKDTNIFDNITHTPISSTSSFYDFIVNEIIPYFSKNYRISNFRVIVGQGSTANFSNFFLLKQNPLIRGIISISPTLSKNMNQYLKEYLTKANSKIVYTLSSSEKDFETIFNEVLELKNSLDSINNKNFKFKTYIFENENHYTLPSVSIPKSIRTTYSMYSDIDKSEYDSIISNLNESPIDYLRNKYELISTFYDIDKTISVNDFMAIEQYIEENEYFKFYDELSKLAFEEYPKTILPSYYKGRYLEETGNYEKAMHIYRSAYIMNEVVGLKKDYLLELADKIQEELNY